MKTYGKIILIGEHSVVYNHKAIAIPFKTGYIETVVTKHPTWYIESKVFKGLLNDIDEEFDHVKKLIYKISETLGLSSLKIHIKSTLPISAGLGSSAAVAASITKALYAYHDQELSWENLFEYVQFSERIAHGVSSGIDTLITTTTNGYMFSKDGEKEKLNYDIDAYLIVGNSKEKGSTKLAVETVKKHAEKSDGKANIDLLGKLAIDFYNALKGKNIEQLGLIMNKAHESLAELSLETKTLHKMILDARENGALGSKLTGAGLGGCVIALAKDYKTAQVISRSWENQGFDSWIMDMKEAS